MNMESDWTVYRTRFVVRARQLTDTLIFTDALGRQQSGRPGDYLVEIFDGLLSITPRRFFEDIYVPLEPAGVSGLDEPVRTGTASNDRPSPADRAAKSAEPPSPQAVNDRGSPFGVRALCKSGPFPRDLPFNTMGYNI